MKLRRGEMTFKEAAEEAGVCVKTIKMWRAQKRFAIRRYSARTVRIIRDSWDDFIQSITVTAKQRPDFSRR